MNSPNHPKDLLGNDIKKGALAHVDLPRTSVICTIGRVEPARLLEDGTEVEGFALIVMKIPHQGLLPMVHILLDPGDSRIEVANSLPRDLDSKINLQ